MFICNRHCKLETTQIHTCMLMNKQIVVYPYNGILLNNMKVKCRSLLFSSMWRKLLCDTVTFSLVFCCCCCSEWGDLPPHAASTLWKMQLSSGQIRNSQYLNTVFWMESDGLQSISAEMRCVKALSPVHVWGLLWSECGLEKNFQTQGRLKGE